MNERGTGGAACLDAERLAAFADGRLAGDERLSVERHLADCDTCREVFAEVIRLHRTDLPESIGRTSSRWVETRTAESPRPGAWFGRRPVIVVGGIALAASLLLIAGFRPPWPMFGEPNPYEELVTAAGDTRTLEGRLSGFPYRALRSATRSGGPASPGERDYGVRSIAARIREAAAGSEAPALVHALGVAHLLLGEIDDAIAALERASAQPDPQQASVYSDLSAAYLARADRQQDQQDRQRALAAAERAIGLDPGLPEAHFNRALALQTLNRQEPAQAAWERFLQLDPSSGWAQEARRRLSGLEGPPR